VIRRRLSDERGFSLIELLMAMVIGMLVLMAAFMLFDRTITASGQIADRSEALQRGRLAMDLITRQLRSQVCLGDTAPIVSGSSSSITFYADFSDGTAPLRKRTLTYDATTNTITESVVAGTGTYPALAFTGAATSVPLLTKVAEILDTPTTLRPMFRYYGYQTGTTNGTLVELTSPLSSSDLSRVAVIKVGFRSFAVRPVSNDNNSAVLEDDVYVRVASPGDPTGGPECL
jgi:prepilin-type N-terminal cleavage/methylation domain-containing protein